MHHDLIALRYHHAQVDAAPAGYAVECQVGPSKHQVLQVLHLLGRQRRWTAAALGIAQPGEAFEGVAMNPVPQGLPIQAAGRRRIRT